MSLPTDIFYERGAIYDGLAATGTKQLFMIFDFFDG